MDWKEERKQIIKVYKDSIKKLRNEKRQLTKHVDFLQKRLDAQDLEVNRAMEVYWQKKMRINEFENFKFLMEEIERLSKSAKKLYDKMMPDINKIDIEKDEEVWMKHVLRNSA